MPGGGAVFDSRRLQNPSPADGVICLPHACAYMEALAAYQRAYAIEPAPEAIYGLARCHHQLKEFEAAVARYEEFLRVAPDHEGAPKARGYLGQALAALGEIEAAKGDDAAALALLERALATGLADVDRARLKGWIGALRAKPAAAATLPASAPSELARPAAEPPPAPAPVGPGAKPAARRSRAPLVVGLSAALAILAGGAGLLVWAIARPAVLSPTVDFTPGP